MISYFNVATQTARNMAFMLPEVQFRCCICLDTYNSPVSIPCGHNFCLDCIEDFWDVKDILECPLCKETFSKRPELRINREFAEIIEFFKRSQLPTPEQEEDGEEGEKHSPSQLLKAEDVPCDICHESESASVKSCLMCQASYCKLHLTPHLMDPALQRHRLTDPATFPSSHLCRNHDKLLTMFCKRDQMPVCVQCTERDHRKHEVVPMEKESKKVKTHFSETKASIPQMIHDRLAKMEQIKNSVDLSKKITEREIQSSVQECTMLVTAVERQQAELVEELEARQEEAERRAEELLNKLKQEVDELQTRSSELQHLELTHNPLHLLQSFASLSKLPSTREWSEVEVYSDCCVGAARRAISELVVVCQELADKLSAEEADKLSQYAVDVTLDPETASGWLVLSADRKKVNVSSQKKKTPAPDNPRRFDSCVCVLGKQSFTSGRRYWVVQVGDKPDWDLGVARQSINRKGSITVRPECGCWAICRRKGGSLSACAGPSGTLHLREIPAKVAVFLDYEDGSVSFFDAEAKTHIYTFSSCSFTEPLRPYFNPRVQDDGKNSTPLIICPAEERLTDIATDSNV